MLFVVQDRPAYGEYEGEKQMLGVHAAGVPVWVRTADPGCGRDGGNAPCVRGDEGALGEEMPFVDVVFRKHVWDVCRGGVRCDLRAADELERVPRGTTGFHRSVSRTMASMYGSDGWSEKSGRRWESRTRSSSLCAFSWISG